MSSVKLTTTGGNGGTVELKGPADTTSNAAVQLTLPVDDGTSGQYLKTDGAGVLSWATVAGGISHEGSTANGVLTYKDADEATVESTLTYDSGTLQIIGAEGSSAQLRMKADEGDDNGDYWKIKADTNGEFVWQNDVSGSQVNKFKIKSGGDIEVSDGNLVVASGHGIDFSATGDGTTMSSELLDDYEEGQFAVTMDNSVTLTQDDLQYIKVGKLVHVSGLLSVNSDNSSSHFTINNLPFAGGAGYIDLSTPSVRLNNWDLSSDCKFVGGYTETNKVYFQQVRDNATCLNLEADSGADIIINLTYIAA